MQDENELIKFAVKSGTEAGIVAWHKEQEKLQTGRHDMRLRNTKLLFKNYRMFKKHCENAVYDASELDENPIDILDLMWGKKNSNLLMVESIQKSAKRTQIIMAHIDEMLSVYETICKNSGKAEDKRRIDVLTAMYISETHMSADKIAEMHNIDTRTVYKDIGIAIEKMSALVFGVDFLSTKTGQEK